MKNTRPSLVISLDFELLWGVFDKVDFKTKQTYFNNTRIVIPALLDVFNNYDIHVTWATVGMLFNKNWEEWINNIPSIIPQYDNKKLSPYKFAEENRGFINGELCFANSLIDKIIETPGQELGTHTYCHYYCLEPGQTGEAFQADIKMAVKLAKHKGVELKSLVFPRNQFNQNYLKICKELGITSVRTNPDNWYWQDTEKDSLPQKIFRTGDAYWGLNDKCYSLSEINCNNYPVQQKASRFLRPREGKFKNSLKLNRIFKEMDFAAKKNRIYHFWWHPHNFGNDPQGNIDDLKRILDHFKKCQENFGMQSNNMAEITQMIEDSF